MSRQYWNEPGGDAPLALGTLQNTYTTAKSVSPAGTLMALAPGFWVPGKRVRLTTWGVESHRVTGPDTMTFQVQLGAIAACSSGALTLTTTSHVLIPFKAECNLMCQVGGVAAQLRGLWTVEGQGFVNGAAVADAGANSGYAFGPNSAPALGTAFDATVAQNMDFFVAQSVSNVLNGIQVYDCLWEVLN